MKCKRCDGDGVIIYYDYQYADKEVCPDCDGNGVVEPLTEQEYLQTCNTEQLADFIADVCYELLDDVWSNDGDTSCDYRETEKNYWVEWLKQPHKPKE